MIQNLSTNIKHSKLRVDPTILIVHRFQIFPDKKTCIQPCRGVHEKGHATLIITYIFSDPNRIPMLNN